MTDTDIDRTRFATQSPDGRTAIHINRTPVIAPPLIQIKVARRWAVTNRLMQWQDIATAPPDRDLELAVIDTDGPHALAFACRRDGGGWINAKTRKLIDVRPTHWREWTAKS